MQETLRYAARKREQDAYAAEVEKYYRTRTPKEAEDDDEFATASTNAFFELNIDEPRAPGHWQPRSRKRR